MLKTKYNPTRLVADEDRPELLIVEPPASARFRNARFVSYLARWAIGAVWLRITRKNGEQVSARRLRELIERAGGLWVKVGQLLSLRTDIFSTELCQELSQLQYRSVAFPWPIARSILEDDVSSPLERHFDEFETAPFAAASISQVHRAHLKVENVWVAVKVQRPDIRSTFARDLGALRFLVGTLEQFNIMSHLKWDELLWEIEQIVDEETDYRYEEANLRRMKKSLRRHGIYVPDVFSRYCSRRVVVMELLEGALMSDFIEVGRKNQARLYTWLTENDIDPELVGARLLESFLRQLTEDNLFHGDLHPGNIVLLRHSRLAFIDFGTVGSMERRFLSLYKLSLAAMATKDYQKAADLLLLMCDALPDVDLSEVTTEVVRCYRAWDARTPLRGVGYHEKSIGSVAGETGEVLFRHKIVASWQFMRMSRTWSTLDASLNFLMPKINYGRFVGGYQKRAARRSWEEFKQSGVKHWVSGINSAVEEMLLYRGGIVRRQAAVFQSATTKAAYLFSIVFRTLARATVLVGVVLFLAFVHYHTGHVSFLDRIPTFSKIVAAVPTIDPEIWVGLLLLFLYFIRIFVKLYKRFAQRESRIPGRHNIAS